MLFQSPVAAVIATTDLDAMVGFLELFGLTQTGSSTLAASAARGLYGLDQALEVLELRAAGHRHGSVRVIGPVSADSPAGPYDTGAHAFDLYTRDIDASVAAAATAGWAAGPVGDVELGPLKMRQAMIKGPDDVCVVLIESERRRPSLLDSDLERRYSEGHSFIWAVDDIDAALPFWRGLPGLTVPFDAPVRHPEINRFMQLPDDDAGLRMAMICDAEVSPMRLELLQFVGFDGPARQTMPVRAGLVGVLFEVPDLEGARDLMAGAELGDVVSAATADGPRRACRGEAPGGVGFELWERR